MGIKTNMGMGMGREAEIRRLQKENEKLRQEVREWQGIAITAQNALLQTQESMQKVLSEGRSLLRTMEEHDDDRK